MTKLRCAHCGIRFTPAPQVPNQAYCSKPDCQKERRRQWQKSKLQSDPDYRDNQSRAQKAWTDRNPEYWRNHRLNRPDYGNTLPGEQASDAPEPGNQSVARCGGCYESVQRDPALSCSRKRRYSGPTK